jgi:hypothetical protein
MFTHTGGDRGKAECGASAVGDGGNASHSAVSVFDGNETALAPTSVAPVKAPLTRGFCFLS